MRSWVCGALLSVFLFGLAISAEESARVAYVRCFANQPSPKELTSRLESAAKELANTEVHDDILLALSDSYQQQDRVDDAVKVLEQLRSDTTSTRLDLRSMWRSGMASIEMEAESQIEDYYRQSPDLTFEHAELRLAAVYAKSSEMQKAWDILERLTCRYPEGDRCVQDTLMFVGIREKMRAKAPTGGDDFLRRRFAETVHSWRRPHLDALRAQLALCQLAPRLTPMRSVVLFRIAKYYAPFCKEEMMDDYCAQGLRSLDNEECASALRSVADISEARRVFALLRLNALLTQDQREHMSTPLVPLPSKTKTEEKKPAREQMPGISGGNVRGDL